MKNLFHFHPWSILWCAVIVILTAIPGDMIPRVPSFIDLFQPDKLVHLFMFALYVFLLLREFNLKDESSFAFRHAVLLTMNISVFLSGITELMQKYFIPGRVASVYDFIANVAGCLLGWWIFAVWMKRKKRLRGN